MPGNNIKDRIEQLCELLVLTDVVDLRSLADLHSRFEEIARWAEGESGALVADAAKASAELIEQIILGEVDDPEAAMEVLGKAVAALQAIVRDGRDPEQVVFPAELGLGTSSCLQDSSSDAAPGGPSISPQAEDPCPLDGYKGLLGDFVAEATDHLEAAEIHLLTLETSPDDEEALNAVFRAFHTIKGVAGFLALADIGSLAHEAENLLDRARKGELPLSGTTMDAAFDAVDMLKGLVDAVKCSIQSGNPLAGDSSLPQLIERIRSVSSDEAIEGGPAMPVAEGEKLGTILVESGKATREAVDEALERQRGQNPAERRKLGELLVESGQVPAKDVARALRAQGAAARHESGAGLREPVKVDADRLDRLVDTIGELVIAESTLTRSEAVASRLSPDLDRHMARLDKITRELEELGTSLRMVPIRSTFQKMARLVRDLAKKAGKLIEFAMSGEDTELDKTVIERIGDPLVHLIRNAVDHGIEDDPEERQRAGKPEVGRIALSAYHKGGSVYIRVEDDGKGFDREAVLAKAIERGLVGEGESLNDRDLLDLIFNPGFSTAKKVTEVSGRGVGLDVVRRNVEALHGQIDVASRPGKGTVFTLRLPLTLAIIDGMVVLIGAERYIIPTVSIVRTFRPEQDRVLTVFSRREMLSLPDELVPLIRLGRLLGIEGAEDELSNALVVIAEDEGKRVGLLVDELLGRQQTVIKPLGNLLRNMAGFSGGTIMPDGRVGLILDVAGLIRLAHLEEIGGGTGQQGGIRGKKPCAHPTDGPPQAVALGKVMGQDV